jgi:hypothetical protein
MKTNVIRNILGGILVFTGLNAVVAGAFFVIDPTGAKMGMGYEYIAKSPFKDFLIPGLTLFLVNGIGSLAGAYLCFAKKPAAGYAGTALGAILCGWIFFQMLWVPFSVLQPVMAGIGVVEAALGLLIIRKQQG